MSEGDDLLVVLVYVDDIIFGCTNDPSVQWFANSMQTEFVIRKDILMTVVELLIACVN